MKQKGNVVKIIASAAKNPNIKPAAIRELMKKLDMNEKGFAVIMNVTVDTVRLWTAGAVKPCGTAMRIMQILNACPEVVNSVFSVTEEKSLLRSLISTCSDISEKAYSEEGSADELVEFAEAKIFDIAGGRDTKSFKHIRDVIGTVYQNLHTLATEGEGSQGTKTGFSGIDSVLAGMGNSDLILIGARPGMGKTSFALNIATNVAQQNGKNVCIFSLEMSAEQLVSRIISSEAMIDSYAMRTGKLDTKQWQDLAATTTKLASLVTAYIPSSIADCWRMHHLCD